MGVAQLVERWIVVPVAEGSNPSTHPSKTKSGLYANNGGKPESQTFRLYANNGGKPESQTFLRT